MANSRKSVKKSATVAQFPQPASAAAVENVPEQFQETAETAPAPASSPPRNPLKKKDPKIPTGGDFFARVAAIKQEDWDSQRIYIYLYVLEPWVNLKQSGGKSYLNRYSQPVRDEHQIAVEYGSGRYRLMLAYNKVSPDESTEIARVEFEIYNPQYPPKVPKAAWINDPRNAKWEALLPKEVPPIAATAASTIVDAMKMVSDIRRDVRDEIGEPDEQQSRTSEVLETMKAAKDLFGPAAATGTAAKDPLEIAVALATTMMQMKADNPVIDMYRDELKALREEMKEERAASRLAAPPVASKSFLDQALELAQNADKLEPLKKMLGFGTGEVTGRAARTTGMDILNNLVSGPAGTMLAQGLGTLLVNLPRMFTPAEGTPGQGQPQPQPIVLPPPGAPPTQMPETPEQKLQRIGMTVTEPMLYEFFLRGATGDVWADRMNDLWPNDYAFVKSIGPDVLVNHYRQTRAWMLIAPKEMEFKQFMTEFCAFDPNAENEQPDNDDSGIVDLEAEEAEA